MNFLAQLPSVADKKKKRLGRGAGTGRGAKSTRGTTRHQKAREAIPLHFEGGKGKMTKKYPLLRGKSKNKSHAPPVAVITLDMLNNFSDGDVVDIATLIKKGMIDDSSQIHEVKILANGKVQKKLTVKIPVSKKARQLIEKVGGKVE